jgi:tRNA pseudouridine55 synthase
MKGFLVVDKPSEITSHQVVKEIRALLPKGVKVGHTGTLDPLATGVLILSIGKATRLSEYLLKKDKCYRVKGVFGLYSPTYDVDGEVERRECREISREELLKTLKKFKGEITQKPPPYSAVRVKGKRAYQLAREGKEVELPERRVRVDRLELLSFNYPEFELSVCCSSGTYIRSLIYDIGKELGCPAVVKELRRTKVGKVGEERAVSLEELKERGVDEFLIQPQELLNFPIVKLTEEEVEAFKRGRKLRKGGLEEGLYSVLTPEGEFAGIGEVRKGELLPRRVLL